MIDPQRLTKIRERVTRNKAADRIDKDEAVVTVAKNLVLQDLALEMLAELERLNDPDDPPTIMLESPYAGKTAYDVAKNEDYARRCLLNSVRLGEAPMAGHLLYTQVLKDANPTERELGIRSHLAWLRRSRGVVLYTDRGMSSGMKQAVELGLSLGVPIKERELEGYKGYNG